MNGWKIENRFLGLRVLDTFVRISHPWKNRARNAYEKLRDFELGVTVLILKSLRVNLLRYRIKMSVYYATLAKRKNTVEWFLLCQEIAQKFSYLFKTVNTIRCCSYLMI